MAINTMNINIMIEEIKKYEMAKKEMEEKIKGVKNSIKAIMNDEGVDEIKTDKFIVRNKSVSSNRFDTKRFKVEHEDMYNAYLVESVSERFTIS